jgi:DNA ligase D-like protein (predicted 3'-phosphoesterase)
MRGTTGNEKDEEGTGREEDKSPRKTNGNREEAGTSEETGKREPEQHGKGAGRKKEDIIMKKEEVKAGTTPGPGEPLKEYRGKRDFSATTEPAGVGTGSGKGDIFVVHEHHASHLHWDLRLERDGVLKSWAVPKGIPAHPGEPHLAIETEDHPLEYGSFEGEIPKGQYGAGTVSIWDTGTYETIKWTPEKIELVMHGRRLEGLLALIRFRKAGPGEWLLIRGKD